MFDKIYDRLHLVNNIDLSEEEKRALEHQCQHIVRCGYKNQYNIQEVIDCLYSFICKEFTTSDALVLTKASLALRSATDNLHLNF